MDGSAAAKIVGVLDQHVEPFRLGVTVRVFKDRIGTDNPPIQLVWEKHKAPDRHPKLNPNRLTPSRLKRLVQYAHEVEFIGRSRVVHYAGDERVGTLDCDVNPLPSGPRVVIEAEDARIVR